MPTSGNCLPAARKTQGTKPAQQQKARSRNRNRRNFKLAVKVDVRQRLLTAGNCPGAAGDALRQHERCPVRVQLRDTALQRQDDVRPDITRRSRRQGKGPGPRKPAVTGAGQQTIHAAKTVVLVDQDVTRTERCRKQRIERIRFRTQRIAADVSAPPSETGRPRRNGRQSELAVRGRGRSGTKRRHGRGMGGTSNRANSEDRRNCQRPESGKHIAPIAIETPYRHNSALFRQGQANHQSRKEDTTSTRHLRFETRTVPLVKSHCPKISNNPVTALLTLPTNRGNAMENGCIWRTSAARSRAHLTTSTMFAPCSATLCRSGPPRVASDISLG